MDRAREARLAKARAILAAAPAIRKMRAGTAKWEDVRSLHVQLRAAGASELASLLEGAMADRTGTPSDVIGELLEQGSQGQFASLLGELNDHPIVKEASDWLAVLKALRGR